MIKLWICLLGMLSLPALSLAQASETQFQQIALLVIEQRLEQRGDAPLSGVLSQIGQETFLPDTEVRHRLVDLLDNLETQRQGKSAVWKKLLELGKKQGSQKRAEKLLRQVTDNTRKALLNPSDYKGRGYDLKAIVDDAEEDGQFPPGQGKDLVLQMLSLGAASTVPRLAGIPQKIKLLVEVQITPPEVASSAAESLTPEEGSQEKLAVIAPQLLPSLVKALSASGYITWAGDQPTAQSTPGYHLVVTLQDLKDSNNGGPQQLSLTGQLTLLPLVDEAPVYQRPLLIKRVSSKEKALDPTSPEFSNEVATKIRYILDAYLSAR